MNLHRGLSLIFLASVSASPLVSQTHSPQLTYVLKQMDTASAKFQRATADFKWDYYERVVRDTTSQNGQIYFERDAKSTTMGAIIYGAGTDKGKPKLDKVLAYRSGTLQMFDTGVDQLTVIRAGSNQAQYEGFLTLGFGGSGTDLDKNWNIEDKGPDTITDNGQPVKVEQLDLTARDPAARSNFSHITIWVDPSRAVSLKQIFYTPTGNTRTATYSNIKVNGNVHKDQFAIKKDKNTTVVNR